MPEPVVDLENFDQVMVPTYVPAPMVPVRGQGSRVWDQAGREYVDLAGGIAVNALGHCHPRLVEALERQARRLWHVSNFMANEPALRLATKLVEATFAERVFFVNSGAEANEAALKLARRHAYDRGCRDKTQIVACVGAFHGRTLFTVTAGGQRKYTEGFGPVPGDIVHGAFDDLASMRALIGARTCAVIVEPVQGESGIVPASAEFLAGLRALCDEHNALLIFDEVQSGVGRTGELYAYMGYGVTPDILTSAKGLGGGFPIGAMLTTARIAATFVPGTHGSTFGGNPLACAVAETVLDVVNDRALLDGVKRKAVALADSMRRIGAAHDVFREVREHGLWIGCELQGEWEKRAGEVMNAACEAGVITLVAGPNVLRLAPSLVIPDEDLAEGADRLGTALSTLCA